VGVGRSDWAKHTRFSCSRWWIFPVTEQLESTVQKARRKPCFCIIGRWLTFQYFWELEICYHRWSCSMPVYSKHIQKHVLVSCEQEVNTTFLYQDVCMDMFAGISCKIEGVWNLDTGAITIFPCSWSYLLLLAYCFSTCIK